MIEEFPFHPFRPQRKHQALTININVTTLNRPTEYTQGIINSIQTNTPFVIYHDKDDFLITLPQFRIVMCFTGGEISTKELLQDEEKYINRIKMGMTVYENFATVEDFYRDMSAIENVYLLSKK